MRLCLAFVLATNNPDCNYCVDDIIANRVSNKSVNNNIKGKPMSSHDHSNTLYYGDNLTILREYIPDESVDLIYLDPPFNSKRTYNVLFKYESGEESAAQISAFEDTWHWDLSAEEAYHELVTESPDHVSRMITALRDFIGENQMMAYLVMMAVRLVELHRVLKPTGSLYLHCDPTASHYLKIVLDTIFEPQNYINEIVWHRSHTRSSISQIYRRAHDIIFFYAKSSKYKFNLQYKALSESSLKLYSKEDSRGKYQAVPLLVSGIRHGETGKIWRGIDPNTRGKSGMHWVTTPKKLEEYDKQGLIVWPKKKGGIPRLKYYLTDNKGVPADDLWDDIKFIASSSNEALGYPTQKPLELLERIVQASSNEGDIVLDPFCGCGTTIAAAQKLGRNWIGIDITHLSIALQKYRLTDMFGDETQYNVIGEPETTQAAKYLANHDRFQFEWWALSLVRARPSGAKQGSKRGKKGADQGIDGIITFIDEAKGKAKRILVQVKSGKVGSRDIRDLVGTVEREKAVIGVFITLNKATKPMKKEAVSAGYYESIAWGTKHPKIQILTIEALLNGEKVDMPPSNVTFKQASKIKQKGAEQKRLL